jgi:sarcosine oxidase subunit gamma
MIRSEAGLDRVDPALPAPPGDKGFLHAHVLVAGAGPAGLAAAPDVLARLRAMWEAAAAPRGWWAWREEGWAWLHLSGTRLPGVLARLCAVDLRPGWFAADSIAQARVAGMDAVVIRCDGQAAIPFDITSTATMLRAIATATAAADEGETP